MTIPSAEHQTQHRPLIVTILIEVVLIFMSLNILRAITAIRARDFLGVLPLNVPVLYIIITGAIWGMIGVVLLFGLISRQKWSPLIAKICVILYATFYWVNRLLFTDINTLENRWWFMSGLTIFLVCITYAILLHSKTREFFRK